MLTQGFLVQIEDIGVVLEDHQQMGYATFQYIQYQHNYHHNFLVDDDGCYYIYGYLTDGHNFIVAKILDCNNFTNLSNFDVLELTDWEIQQYPGELHQCYYLVVRNFNVFQRVNNHLEDNVLFYPLQQRVINPIGDGRLWLPQNIPHHVLNDQYYYYESENTDNESTDSGSYPGYP